MTTTRMTTSLALQLAAEAHTGGPSPVLASRPGGVLHVYVGPLTPGGQVPRGRRPVCNRALRRLRQVPDQPCPRRVGHHHNGQRTCARCQAHLARTAVAAARAGWAAQLIATAQLRATELITSSLAGGEPREVIADHEPVGVIAYSAGRWHVHSAGAGVPVNRSLRVPTSAQAVEVLAIARELAALPGGAVHVDDAGLTVFDRTLLDFAARTYPGRTVDGARNGRSDADVTSEFGVTPNRFAQLLNALIDRHDAEAYAPQLVHRLRDQRDRRAHLRRDPALTLGGAR